MNLTNRINGAIKAREIIVDKWGWENEEQLAHLYEVHLSIEEAQEVQNELESLRRSVTGLEMQVQALAEQCGYRERTKRDV